MFKAFTPLLARSMAIATHFFSPAAASVLVATTLVASPAQAATMSEADLQNYAVTMTAAANAKSVSRVNRLIDDNALISVTRKGRVSTLNKTSYLNLLQLNWAKTHIYSYQMRLDNAVITGNQAKADIQTIEVLEERGQITRLITDSRATFVKTDNGVVLTRAFSQLTIEQP